MAAIGDLGDLPLVVLEAAQPDNDDPPPGISQESLDEVDFVFARSSPELQLELAGLSSSGTLIKVDGSGHFIHLDRPDAVIDAIQSVLAESGFSR